MNRGGSYINSPLCIKSTKATINHITIFDNKCLKYAVTLALSHKEIGKNSEKISKIIFL